MNQELNSVSLDTLCAALAQTMGVDAPASAAAPNPAFLEYTRKVFGGGTADRIFMYNPDAVAQWIYEKYANLMQEVIRRTELAVPMQAVMPSVTPVCFGTMYTGAQPAVHGIRSYTKPVITIGINQDILCENYDTNDYTLWIEEQTGIDLQFNYFADDETESAQQLNAMIAAGEKLPDILWHFSGMSDALRA